MLLHRWSYLLYCVRWILPRAWVGVTKAAPKPRTSDSESATTQRHVHPNLLYFSFLYLYVHFLCFFTRTIWNKNEKFLYGKNSELISRFLLERPINIVFLRAFGIFGDAICLIQNKIHELPIFARYSCCPWCIQIRARAVTVRSALKYGLQVENHRSLLAGPTHKNYRYDPTIT